MPTQITIRNVPDDVHKELKERAALKGQSMQGRLRREFGANRVKALSGHMAGAAQKAGGENVSIESILKARDADRT